MVEYLIYWWLSGALPCWIAGLYLSHEGMKSKDFFLVTAGSSLFGILGPVLTYFIIKWFWEAWRDQFAIDDEGKRLYPWVKDQ